MACNFLDRFASNRQAYFAPKKVVLLTSDIMISFIEIMKVIYQDTKNETILRQEILAA